MIIDAHIHPHPPFENMPDPAQMAETTIGHMDRAGIGMSGLLGVVLPGQSEGQIRGRNDYTQAMVAAYPRRFFGLCFINPALSLKAVSQELDRCLQQPEFLGIKLEIDINARDPRLDIVMQKAIEYDVPVLHHAWYLNLWQYPCPEHQANRSEPRDIAHLARRFPEANILMAHLEGCGIRGIIDIAELPNVYVDTSGSQPFTGTLEFALQYLGADRILFGSDLYGRSLASQLGRIAGCAMSKRDRSKVLGENTRRLFKVEVASTEELAMEIAA